MGKKNLILCICAIFSFCIAAEAQEKREYKPILTEGKVWEVIAENPSVLDGPGSNIIYTITMAGDAVENGTVCKKLISTFEKDGYTFYAYEKEGVLYVKHKDLNPNEFVSILDLNVKKGDIPRSGTVVTEVEDKCVMGQIRKSIYLATDNKMSHWVEGIGPCCDFSTITPFPEIESELPEFNYKRHLLRCYQNDELLYSRGEFLRGDNDFHPVVSNGKRWNIETVHPGSGDTEYSFLNVIGDIKINGLTLKNLSYEGPYLYAYILAYEEDGVVYETADGRFFNELIDMKYETGDVAPSGDRIISDFIEINGSRRKRIKYESRDAYWIEGIGANTAGYWIKNKAYPDSQLPVFHRNLSSCREGDVWFSKEDFTAPAASLENVGMSSDSQINSDITYDINGLIIDKPARGQVYIKNGKQSIMTSSSGQ